MPLESPGRSASGCSNPAANRRRSGVLLVRTFVPKMLLCRDVRQAPLPLQLLVPGGRLTSQGARAAGQGARAASRRGVVERLPGPVELCAVAVRPPSRRFGSLILAADIVAA